MYQMLRSIKNLRDQGFQEMQMIHFQVFWVVMPCRVAIRPEH